MKGNGIGCSVQSKKGCQLATVRNTALDAVFLITFKLQFSKLDQEKKSCKYSIKSVSHLIIIRPIVN